MKVRVISLKSRQDRRDLFTKNNGEFLVEHDWAFVDAVDGSALTYQGLLAAGFDTDKQWRDPLLKRTLTKGEIGCFLSHWRLWEECAELDEPILVLEDDAYLKDHVDISVMQDADLTYLTHKEMLPRGVIKNQVCYPYWTAAYLLTPHGARTLLNTDADVSIIPVDEFLPRMTDRLLMTSVDLAGQIVRAKSGSNVEPKGHSSFIRDFTVHNLTCGDNPTRMTKLTETNPDVRNILSSPWEAGTMQGPGGGQKINEIRNYLDTNHVPDQDVIIFTDSFDVFFMRSIDEVVGRFLEMKSKVVFAAERFLWPDKSLRFPPVIGPYRYLNSGCFIGRAGELRRILADPIENHHDDQLYLQKAFLSGKYQISLDTEQFIFMTHEPLLVIKKGQILNPITRCYGCVYHGNGGSDAKEQFDRFYTAVFPEKRYSNLSTYDYREIGNEMLLVDFLTPTQCEEWIRIGEEHGGWNPHPADKVPSHDIHLKLLGLWDECESWWSKVLAPVFERYWKPTHHHHLRKAFLMKYSEDTQRTLGLHNDASLVTGSVKLNDNYEGATLIFPRQNVTNADIPPGKMIVFPGQLTHGHHVDRLESGTKFSATFWTARFKNDLLNP